MMMSIKISKDVSIQRYLNNGIKILVRYNHKDKTKYFTLRFDDDKTHLLKFIINILSNDK